MPTRIWQSSGSVDWNATANWSTATVPITDDEAWFPNGNAISVTTNVTGQAAVDLDLLYTDVGYSGNIGAGGGPLTISADKVWIRGSGNVYYTDGNGTTDLMIIDCASPTSVVEVSGATVTTLVALRGTITISGTVTNIYVGYNSNQQSDVTLTISGAAATSTLLKQNGGKVDSSNTITTMMLDEGTHIKTALAGTTTYQRGGLLQHDSTTTPTILYGMGGILDMTKSAGLKTFAQIDHYPGYTIRKVSDANVHAITLWNDFRTSQS